MIRTEHKENQIFSYVEYAPEKPEGKLPLIIQLHGAGERGDGDGELILVDRLGFSKHLREKDYNCRVIMPQCPTDTFWAAKVESILKFIEEKIEEYDADEDRVYLTGISMGGYGTWYTAMAKPSLFAAIAPICGGGMAWNAHVLTMPVRVFHGTADDAVSVTQSDEMAEKIKKAGGDVTYTRMEGVGHNVWDHTYDSALMEWLLSKKRA